VLCRRCYKSELKNLLSERIIIKTITTETETNCGVIRFLCTKATMSFSSCHNENYFVCLRIFKNVKNSLP
jgi:hypothetical protein